MARVCRLWSCGAGAARRWPQHAWSAHARPNGRCLAPPIYYARAAATAASQEPAKRHDGAAGGGGAAVAEAKAEAKASPASLAQLWSVLRPERRRLQLAVGALCASSSVNLSYPYLMGRLVDVFGSSADGLAFVLDHVFTCGGAICIGGIATFCRLYLIETSIERVSYRLRREFFSALLQRDIAFFDKNKTGELVNRLGNDITVTSRVLIDCSAGIRSIITACVGTFMVFKLAPTEMMVTLLAPVAGLFVLGVGYGRLVRRISERRQERLAEAVQLAEERLSGIRTVRTFNAEASELRSFEHRLESVYAAGRQNALASGGLSCLFVTGGGLFLLHIVYNCGMLVTSGVVSIGSTMSLAMYCFMAGSSYTGIMTAYGDIQKGLGACQKVLSILNDEAAGREPSSVQLPAMPPAKVAADIGPAAVRFEDVGFAYPARPDMPVLRGLDLDIPAGARVAILGRSGSGKSTLAALLAGLYAPAAGRVLVDGLDLFAEPGRAAWARHQLGVIGQDPTLFTLTLRENVSYGLDGEEDDDERRSAVDDAVRAAHVSEFASTLPQGLDTPAGERGRALSGGQKQRVCIARALARRPRMLVFDEATSALDMRSEQLVHTALEEVLSSRSCTCLVITHRLSALRWTDRVAVIEEGRVAQYGPQEEVMAYPCPALRSIMRSDGDSAD